MAYIERNKWRWTTEEAKRAARKPRKKQPTFPLYTREDLAETAGVSIGSLNTYLKTNKIRLSSLSLEALFQLIKTLKETRPLNTNCKRYKSTKLPPIPIEDEDGEF